MHDKRRIDRHAFIFDDEPALRTLVRRMLTSSGVYTEEFDTAEAFLTGLSSRPIGCVILDIQLPGMNGLDLLNRLKEARVPSPVVILSGQGEVMAAVRAVKEGAFDYVQKPFRKSDLMQPVESAFAHISSLSTSPSARLRNLTARERQTLSAFSGGASNKVVARTLGLSVRTVEMHRANLVHKLGVQNLTQALLLAEERGIA